MAAITAEDMAAETANAFSDAGVSGAGSSTAVTLSGATTGAGYVVCYMDKEGTLTIPVETAAIKEKGGCRRYLNPTSLGGGCRAL